MPDATNGIMRLIRFIYPYIGLTFATAGLLHIFLGFIIFNGPFRDILRAGVFNSIGFDYDHRLDSCFSNFSDRIAGLTGFSIKVIP